MKRDLEKAALTPELGPGESFNGAEVPVGPLPPSWRGRALRRAAFVLLLLAAVAVLVGGWWVMQKDGRVLSRNALVRGELTDIGTRFPGVLLSTEVQPGSRVRAGDVLARLDDRHLRAQESEALAQLEALERALVLERAAIVQERLSRTARVQEVEARALAAQGDVRAAQLRVSEADEYQRVRQELADTGIISADAMREVQSRTRLARESLGVSMSNGRAAQAALRNSELELSGVALRQQHLGVLEAQLGAARARLARVRADMASTLITAPTDGTVVRWWANAGSSVDVGKPVVSFSMGDRRWVEAWVDEDDASRIRVGDAATVTMPFQAGRELEGVVTRIGVTTEGDPPQVGPLEPRPTRIRLAPVVSVEVALSHVPESLLPGLSAAVAIRPAP
jgi:multidrug resistance efflux pump